MENTNLLVNVVKAISRISIGFVEMIFAFCRKIYDKWDYTLYRLGF